MKVVVKVSSFVSTKDLKSLWFQLNHLYCCLWSSWFHGWTATCSFQCLVQFPQTHKNTPWIFIWRAVLVVGVRCLLIVLRVLWFKTIFFIIIFIILLFIITACSMSTTDLHRFMYVFTCSAILSLSGKVPLYSSCVE